MPGYLSFREYIRWLPDEATEPTVTIVLSGKESGAFVDVRFMKNAIGTLDWAFAGFRHADGANRARFEHLLDSRTPDPTSVDDSGTTTALPEGRSLERGMMANPDTGALTDYEELWREEEAPHATIVRRLDGSVWKAHVGNWQLEVGRNDHHCWAWQASWGGGSPDWHILHRTANVGEAKFLPDKHRQLLEWAGDDWEILEYS
ncbi:hypothetical protein HDZ31DRAFT_46423 [Schizophyllum fasciatum]